jgi:hypothetical protein
MAVENTVYLPQDVLNNFRSERCRRLFIDKQAITSALIYLAPQDYCTITPNIKNDKKQLYLLEDSRSTFLYGVRSLNDSRGMANPVLTSTKPEVCDFGRFDLNKFLGNVKFSIIHRCTKLPHCPFNCPFSLDNSFAHTTYISKL